MFHNLNKGIPEGFSVGGERGWNGEWRLKGTVIGKEALRS